MVETLCILFCMASDLCHEFWGKSERAKSNTVLSLLKGQALKYQIDTFETQRSPLNMTVDVLDFMEQICQNISEYNCDRKFISAIDQNLVFFASHSMKTLE